MPKTITLELSPKQAADDKFYIARAAERLGIRQSDIALARVVKRSIDARQRMAKVNLTLEVYIDQEPQPEPLHFDYPMVDWFFILTKFLARVFTYLIDVLPAVVIALAKSESPIGFFLDEIAP